MKKEFYSMMKVFKTGFFIYGLGVAALFSGCKPISSGTQKQLEEYRKQIMLYYPYSENEELVFVNDSLARTWTAKANDRGKRTYPVSNISLQDSYGTESYGDWTVSAEAGLSWNGIEPTGLWNMQYTILYGAYGKAMNIEWYFSLHPTPDEYYQGGIQFTDLQEDILAYFTDTLILLIPNQTSAIPSGAAPEGAYVRLVKHQGITDFSTDGKTVWRRVKQ
jgi:hypothetical protein